MEDIAPGLLEALVEDYEKNKENSELIQLIKGKLEDGSATYADANDYAIELGDILANAYAHNISSDILPDGRMYYNIADRVIRPTMVRSYDDISKATVKIQQSLNEKANIGIKAIKPVMNEDRVKGLVNVVTHADKYDDVAKTLDSSIKNYTQSIVDDAVKVNTEFHGKSGLTPVVVRKIAGNCCEWCSRLAGKYSYPDVPKDVYRRHRHCRCTVDYDPGTGKVQNVHSKQWKEADEELERRKTIGLSETSKEELERRKTIGLTETTAEELERRKSIGLGDESVEKTSKSGTIKSVELPSEISSIKGMTPDTEKAISDAFDNIKREYNVRIDNFEVMSLGPGNDIVPFQYVPENVGGYFKYKLVINKDYYFNDSLEKYNQRIMRNYNSGALASQSIEDLIAHEMAHVMTFQDCDTYGVFESVEEEVRYSFIRGMSNYADGTYDGAETIAEAFVRYRRGEVLPDDVMDLLNKYILGRKK